MTKDHAKKIRSEGGKTLLPFAKGKLQKMGGRKLLPKMGGFRPKRKGWNL